MLSFPTVAGCDAPSFLDRALVLAAGVGALRRHWLETRCGCGASTQIPLRMLAEQGQGARTIADVLIRLRCKSCGRAPIAVHLIEDLRDAGVAAYGGTPAWRVVLIERAAE